MPTNLRHDEYRYIAFDECSKSAIGYGPKAIFALQYADQMNSQASIFVIDAGGFGYEVWTLGLDLLGVERLVSAERPRRLAEPKAVLFGPLTSTWRWRAPAPGQEFADLGLGPAVDELG